MEWCVGNKHKHITTLCVTEIQKSATTKTVTYTVNFEPTSLTEELRVYLKDLNNDDGFINGLISRVCVCV